MSSCTYNADQTGLFYAKSPKYLYVNPQENKWYKGYTKMKDKTIFTEMVCNAADGNWVPIALISKFKEPSFFELLRGEPTPITYKDQYNAWFEKINYCSVDQQCILAEPSDLEWRSKYNSTS